MSMLKQVGLLTAGAQPWNSSICSSRGNKFVYCATLAIYIYEYDEASKQFKLHSIMCEHKKTIKAISWQRENPNVLASCSCDGVIIIWSIRDQKVISKILSNADPITNIEWYEGQKNTLCFMKDEGPLFLWNYMIKSDGITKYKDSDDFNCEVCIFKWNLKDKEKVCFGHVDGSVSVSGEKTFKHLFSTLKGAMANDNVLCMEWDPLSVDYLLVSTKCSGIRLIDTCRKTIITHFKPKMECVIQSVCWISNAPGMFLSGDANTGILRLWSVAQDTPLENTPLKETGFHSLFLMDNQYGVVSSKASILLKNNDSFTTPASSVVSVFQDGGVGVYDLKGRKWIFLREKGHIETIFACEFHPDDPNILATGSFDGSIKVWDITTMTAIHVSPGNLSVIYSLSWGPGDTNCILAGTLRYDGVLWNIKKDKITHRYTDHGGKGVHCCSWNRMDRQYIASSGADKYCCIRKADGNCKRYKHPAAVYGCDWCPMMRDMVATGCEDGIVRVFYIPGENNPIKTFVGHTKKVFAVKWSPLKDGILCSGSDDKTIRIWNYTEDACIHCLEGHTQPVRGLLFNPELPHLLISGSWDYSVKVWDTRTGYCIDTSHDHAADVYGIASHPQRPFLFASTSRDSTLRLWTMPTIVQPLYASYLLGHDMKILNQTTDVLSNSDLPLAIGIIGNFMKLMTGRKEDKFVLGWKDDSVMKELQHLSHFLLPPNGISNFWILVSIIQKQNKAIIPENYHQMIMHSSHLIKYKGSQAQELETARSSFQKLIGPKKKAELLIEAARMYMSLGQVEHYCEIMMELNQWEKALSIAPSVSLGYWKSLTKRYASSLTIEENPDAPVYWMASKDIKTLCNTYLQRNQYHEAMLAVQVAAENNIVDESIIDNDHNTKDANCQSDYSRRGPPSTQDVERNQPSIKKLHHQINEALADWYFADGNPVLAACCHLSVDNVEGAICKLLRGNELELAYSLLKIFPSYSAMKKLVFGMLSLRCERYNLWSAAVSIWKEVDDNDFELFMTCARFPGTAVERTSLHVKAGLPSPSECYEKALMSSQQGNLLESLKYYAVSTATEEAIVAALNHIKTLFIEEHWILSDVLPYVKIFGCIGSEMISQLSKNEFHQILAVSAYIGALRAIHLGFESIVSQLFQHAIYIIRKDDIDIGIPVQGILDESEAWLVEYLQNKNDGSRFTQKPTPAQKNVYDKLLKKCRSPTSGEVCGEFIVVGHHIPGHCVSHIHAFTKERIKGPVFILEDGKTALPYSYALMWAHVNMFSPLATGYRLNPF